MVVADVHVDTDERRRSAAPGRAAWDSAIRCWQASIQAAIDNEVQLFCLAGDACATHRPSAEAVELIADGFRRLSDAKILSLYIPGNHELHGLPGGHRHAFSRLGDIPLVNVVNDASIVRYNNGLQVACLPWPRKTGDAARLDVGQLQVEAALASQVADDVSRIGDELDRDQPTLLIGHLLADTVRFGGVDLRGSEQAMSDGLAEPIVSISQLETLEIDMTVLGHIHKRQTLGKTATICYTGSTDEHDAADAGQTKAASLIEWDSSKHATNSPVILPSRKHRTVTVDLDDPDAVESALSTVNEGELVRVSWTGSRTRLPAFVEALAGVGVSDVRTVAPPPRPPTHKASEKLPVEVGTTDALKAWLAKTDADSEMVNMVLAAAETVIAKAAQP